MPTPREPQITAWSYSRWRDHSGTSGCPARAKFKHIMRLPDPGGPALQRGSEIHALAERYVRGDLDYMPDALETFAEEFKALRELHAASPDDVLLEAEWAFDAQMNPVRWNDGRAWLRAKVDLAVLRPGGVIQIVDHKTGGVRPAESEDQLELYGLAGFAWCEGVHEVRAELWYLDHGHLEQRTYPVADQPKLEKLWRNRVAPMLADRKFPARPSAESCRFCPYSKAKKGPCQF
jgi:RecB family exonuclease